MDISAPHWRRGQQGGRWKELQAQGLVLGVGELLGALKSLGLC